MKMNHCSQNARRAPHLLALSVLLLGQLIFLPGRASAQEVEGAAVQIDAPILTAPEDRALTTGATHPPLGVPKLVWTAVTDATRYQVEISTSAGFASTVDSATTYATTYTPDIALPDGDYYWRVKAAEGASWGPDSEVRGFSKQWSDGGALTPQLLSPEEGSVRAWFTGDDFSWTPVLGAATYLFELSTDPSFGAIVYSGTTTRTAHTPTKRPANNLYYWRVTPTDARNNRGQPSQTGSFTFAWNVAPQLIGPANNIDAPFLPRFSWTAVEAANPYQLEISTQPDFGSASIYVTPNTDFTPQKALSNDQDYYWRLRGIDAQEQHALIPL